MDHICSSECECRVDLDKAVVALTEATRILSVSIFGGSKEQIESHYAYVRRAKARVAGALSAFADHFLEPLNNSKP